MNGFTLTHEYKGFTYLCEGDWVFSPGKPTWWKVAHRLKYPNAEIWVEAPFVLGELDKVTFEFWVDMGQPKPESLGLVLFTNKSIAVLIDVHEQLGVPPTEWEQLRLGLKMLSD